MWNLYERQTDTIFSWYLNKNKVYMKYYIDALHVMHEHTNIMLMMSQTHPRHADELSNERI